MSWAPPLPQAADPTLDAAEIAAEEQGWTWEDEEEEDDTTAPAELSAEDFVEKLRWVAQIAVRLARVQYAPAAQVALSLKARTLTPSCSHSLFLSLSLSLSLPLSFARSRFISLSHTHTHTP